MHSKKGGPRDAQGARRRSQRASARAYVDRRAEDHRKSVSIAIGVKEGLMFQAGETEVVRRLLFVGDSKDVCNAVLKVDGFDGEIPCPGKRGKTKVLVRHSTGSAEDATLDNRPEVIHRPCPTCAKKAVGRAIVDGVFILTPGLYWMYRFPEDENLPLAQRQGGQ